MSELARSLPEVEIVDSPETFAERVEELRRANATLFRAVLSPFEMPLIHAIDAMAEFLSRFPDAESGS